MLSDRPKLEVRNVIFFPLKPIACCRITDIEVFSSAFRDYFKILLRFNEIMTGN